MILIQDVNARDLIAAVEGQRWFLEDAQASAQGAKDCTFNAISKARAQVLEDAWACGEVLDPEATLSEYGVPCVIYGAAGYSRYVVKVSGEIIFSRHHGRPEKALQAAKLGFTVR